VLNSGRRFQKIAPIRQQHLKAEKYSWLGEVIEKLPGEEEFSSYLVMEVP
jgi:hypothetical protein